MYCAMWGFFLLFLLFFSFSLQTFDLKGALMLRDASRAFCKTSVFIFGLNPGEDLPYTLNRTWDDACNKRDILVTIFWLFVWLFFFLKFFLFFVLKGFAEFQLYFFRHCSLDFVWWRLATWHHMGFWGQKTHVTTRTQGQ